MNKEYLEILAAQVLVFYNALLQNGATVETADKLSSVSAFLETSLLVASTVSSHNIVIGAVFVYICGRKIS